MALKSITCLPIIWLKKTLDRLILLYFVSDLMIYIYV
jgi:hypothetical protein